MKILAIVLAASMSFPTASFAWETRRELSKITFESTDTTGNGALDYGEIVAMSESIGLSMDADENNEISREEFMEWDFGFAFLAENEGDGSQYVSVKNIIFALWDLNSNDAITPREMRLATRWSFERADTDRNGLLSENEYLEGWLPIVIIKNGRRT